MDEYNAQYDAAVTAVSGPPTCARCESPTNNTTGVTIEVRSTIGIHQHQLFCHDCYCRFIDWANQKPGKLHDGITL